jgi:signal peptidase
MKWFKYIVSKIVYGACALALLFVLAFFTLPYFPGVGQLDMKIVKSGSMEPAIMTGGVVLIRGVDSYGINDVITFASAGADIPTTHRIIGSEVRDGATFFITKGDANEEPDVEPIAATSIIGKVLFDLPFMGFVLDFARQPLGFGLLVGIPALLIIIDEFDKIYRSLRGAKKKKTSLVEEKISFVPTLSPTPVKIVAREKCHDIVPRRIEQVMAQPKVVETPRLMMRPARLPFVTTSVALLIGTTICVSTFFMGSTVSYMSDIEQSLQNLFMTPSVDFVATLNTSYFGIVDGELAGSPAIITISEINGSVPLLYQVHTEVKAGDPALCAEILATSNTPFVYVGGVSFLASPQNIAFPDPWELAFAAGVVGPFVPGTFCDIDIVITGKSSSLSWIDEVYVDEEVVTVSFVIEEAAAPLAAPAAFSSFLAEEEGLGGDLPPQEPPLPPSEEPPVEVPEPEIVEPVIPVVEVPEEPPTPPEVPIDENTDV